MDNTMMEFIPAPIIAIFMAIMMVPEDVDQFTIDIQDIQYQWTQQESGWHAVKLLRDDLGSDTDKDTEITIDEEQIAELKVNVSHFLTMPENLDWNNVAEIPVALPSLGDPVEIKREDGKIVLSQAKGELFEKPVTITWQSKVKDETNEVPDPPKADSALPLEPGEVLLEVKDGEASVSDELIRRFSVGEKSITASYHNRSEMRMRPRYTIELYNANGILIGEDTIGESSGFFGGGPGYIDPGAVGSGELRVTWYPVDRIFSKSTEPLPDDWATVRWIVIKDNNPLTMKAR